MPRIFEVETHPGPVTHHLGLRLTPFAESWRVRLPIRSDFFSWGLIWNRPVSVVVSMPDGRETITPIIDPTRRLVCAFYGLSALALLLWGWAYRSYKRKLRHG